MYFSVPMSFAAERAAADGLTVSPGVPAWIAAPVNVAADVAALLDQLEEVEEAEAEEAEVEAYRS